MRTELRSADREIDEFGPLGRRLADRYFSKVRVAPEALELMANLYTRGHVIHVMRTSAWINFLYLQWVLQSAHLPPIRAVSPLRSWMTRPFRLVGTTSVERLSEVFGKRQGTLIFLRKSGFNAPRGVGVNHGALAALAALAAKSDEPIFMLPEILVWEARPRRASPDLGERLFGSAEAPRFAHSVFAFLRNVSRAQFRIGEVVELHELLAQHQGRLPIVSHALTRDLDDETRAVCGPPRKTHRRFIDEAMRDRRFRTALEEYALITGRQVNEVTAEAQRKFIAVAARPRLGVIHALGRILRFAFRRMYENIIVDEGSFERAYANPSRAPLVLTPSHKSHLDYVLMSYVLWERGHPTPLVAAGEGLSFFPLGPVLKSAGAFFIRRSFKSDPIGEIVFRAYLKKIVRDGITFEFFPEGGRSRTGKFLPPKFGAFSWLIDAVLEGARDDVRFLPIAIDFERLAESNAMSSEAQGAPKPRDGVTSLFGAAAALGRRYGNVYIRAGAIIHLAPLIAAHGGVAACHDSEARQALTRSVAHRVMYEIARASTVTPQGVLAAAILPNDGKPLSDETVALRAAVILRIAADAGAHLSPAFKDAPMQLDVPGPLRTVLRQLASDGLIAIDDSGAQPTYFAVNDRRIELAYHRNNVANLLAGRTITAAAMVARRDAPQDIRAAAKWLSRILKFEFVFPVGRTFDAIFDETSAHLAQLDRAHAGQGIVEWLALLMADTLASYWVAASVCADLDGPTPRVTILTRALARAQADILSAKLALPESASRPTFDNAIEVFVDLGYLRSSDGKLTADRDALRMVAQTLAAYIFVTSPEPQVSTLQADTAS